MRKENDDALEEMLTRIANGEKPEVEDIEKENEKQNGRPK